METFKEVCKVIEDAGMGKIEVYPEQKIFINGCIEQGWIEVGETG